MGFKFCRLSYSSADKDEGQYKFGWKSVNASGKVSSFLCGLINPSGCFYRTAIFYDDLILSTSILNGFYFFIKVLVAPY